MEEADKRENADLEEERKRPESAIGPDTHDLGEDYFYWWHNQKISLAVFVVLFIIGIFWVWWLLIPAFILLGYNLYANFNRIKAMIEAYTKK